MNVIIFGPPGAGKGTQSQNIVNKFKLFQVSTGDLLRSEIKNKSEIGKEIEEIISKGDFATDDIVNKIINDHKGELEFIPINNGAKIQIRFYLNDNRNINSWW